ncbi:helix-turn-helix domain-containing protein [Jiangella muralis]|uniref:helix-turn-helix domain-containing protein n=1 Tax=Jiangella muralis TaxID=702383 RepID=UPI00069FD728|nr:helix-turn-helix transcriptional regulator [Jiangella muralis]
MTTDPPKPRSALAADVGQQLRQAREAAGLSLRALASQFGVTHVTMRRYERGEYNVSLSKLAEVADLYGLDVKITCTPKRPPA